MESLVRLPELPEFAKQFVQHFSPRQLVLLRGDLGAGKTQFVKCCVSALLGDSFKESVESPTFSIINEYEGSVSIRHVDLYRMESEADVDSTGFWDLFAVSEGVIFVEWPERVDAAAWPLNWSLIEVHIFKENASRDDELRRYQVQVLRP